MMWSLSQIHLVAFISYLYLSLYVLIQNPSHQVNRSLTAFIGCLAIWSLEKVFYCAPGVDVEGAWLWNNIGSVGWIGFSPMFLWFTQTITAQKEAPRDRLLLWGAIAIGAVLLVAQYQRLIIAEFILMPYGWTWRWTGNLWMWAFFIYYLLVMGFSTVLLYKNAGLSPVIPLKFYATGFAFFTLIALATASLVDTIAPLLKVHFIPPIGNVICLLWAAWLGYTIIKRRFLIISPTTAAENIIRAMSDLLVLTDVNWRIVRINTAAEVCLGWDQTHLQGKFVHEIMAYTEQENVFQTVINQHPDQVENLRLELRTRSGRLIPAIFSSTQLMDGTKPAGNVVLIKDISRLQEAETALKNSEQRYRELVESINEVVFSMDDNGIVTFLSPAFESLTGYGIEEAVGQYSANIIHPNDLEIFNRQMRNLYGGNRAFLSVRIRRKHGGCRWVQASCRPSITAGKVVGVHGIITDITEQVNVQKEKEALETRLARAEKMEAIGTLAGAVAHDLNNVLSGIVSYPELMLLELSEKNNFYRMTQTIKASGEKAAAIVQDLLTLARRGVVTTEWVDLNLLINSWLVDPEYQQLKAQWPNVRVKTTLADDLNGILGSPGHLIKILTNLMANAFEAIPADGGLVTIKTENSMTAISPSQALSLPQEAQWVVLKIKDTGSGISPEDQKKIFEPFFTRKVMGRSGTGLGMAVVWGAVQDHNGHIDISSKIGQGTEFIIRFPGTTPAAANTELG